MKEQKTEFRLNRKLVLVRYSTPESKGLIDTERKILCKGC